ncbi:dTDP-4-dehydrorhamnose 3,5-epimerase [Litoreibacter arenae]|uniref:dTDP-4-dehydrorhamnose 3,5-epimerase n=1 Tax=Litoreibacter arenae DSM 19593 TaxID=1123360 RepID=S9QF80_9RHOB|nr:dTDP-4-dehydrorhamnose 3,5-epimerase [Litoreibacter arenae]EPX78547.1 dTDP-4-dehydrorhamnose 3,5-epimerase [Litoreibacter arenae DSM 19593]
MFTENTALPGVVLVTPSRFGDHLGFFSESWNKAKLEDAGLVLPEFVQDNHSLSGDVGTVRGLHFQRPPHAQGKLVRCGRGKIYDVAVDVRKGSATYGKWIGENLSFENGKQLWIPAGFLHGFMTLEVDSEIVYKCTDYYAPECDQTVKWDSCGIEWPLDGITPVISEKDENAQSFRDFETLFSKEII